MKKTFEILALLIGLISCYNSNNVDVSSAEQLAKHETKTDSNNANRKMLISELKRLHYAISTNDKEKIADIFEFPLSRKSFSFYVDDKSFYEQFKSNGNKITRAMFLEHYNAISESIWLEQLKNLFQFIAIDSVEQKETIEYEDYIETEPCFYSYQIELNKDIVTLRMKMKSNKNYQSKILSENNLPENSSEICEHDLWWIFRFDGKQLHLESISGAD